MLHTADDLYWKSLEVVREAFDQLAFARKRYESAVERLRAERTAKAIQDFYKEIDKDRNALSKKTS